MKKILIAVVAVAMVIATQSYVLAGVEYDEGIRACNSGDYKRGFEIFSGLAEKGDATSQFNLGIMYSKGQGVSRDYRQAVAWYQKAAEQGDTGAQFNLGLMYFNGDGVTQDYKQAAIWYQKAAEQGHADAQLNIGIMYAKGQGVPKDHKQATEWWTKAAKQGNKMAQNNLQISIENQKLAEKVGDDTDSAGNSAGYKLTLFNTEDVYKNVGLFWADYLEKFCGRGRGIWRGDIIANEWLIKNYPGSDFNCINMSGLLSANNSTQKVIFTNRSPIEITLDERNGVVYNFKFSGRQVIGTVSDYHGNYVVFRLDRNNAKNANFINAKLPISAEISALGLGEQGTKFTQNELIRLLDVFMASNPDNISPTMDLVAEKLLLSPDYRRGFIRKSLQLLSQERGQ